VQRAQELGYKMQRNVGRKSRSAVLKTVCCVRGADSIEVSCVATPDLDKRARLGRECDLVAAYRCAIRESPTCQLAGPPTSLTSAGLVSELECRRSTLMDPRNQRPQAVAAQQVTCRIALVSARGCRSFSIASDVGSTSSSTFRRAALLTTSAATGSAPAAPLPITRRWQSQGMSSSRESGVVPVYEWYVGGLAEHGLADRDEIDAFERAWKRWAESSDSFAAFAWGRAIGRRP
jgi:hypothetical protein